MSRIYNSDDPSTPAHDISQDNIAAPHSERAGLGSDQAVGNPVVTQTGDYIEAEYVGSDFERQHTQDTGTPHEDAPHSAHSVRDTLTRIPDALGAIGRDISRTLERAISSKDEYVVAVKVSADAHARLEKLVQAGVFRSRAEAAAFLIDEGIEAQAPLFARVEQKLAEIERLRAELRGLVNGNPEETR